MRPLNHGQPISESANGLAKSEMLPKSLLKSNFYDIDIFHRQLYLTLRLLPFYGLAFLMAPLSFGTLFDILEKAQ